MKLEKIQFSSIRLALGLRISTPTNILLAEAKLTTIQNRAKVLCKNFLLKLYNNTRSIAYSTIKKYTKYIINDRTKKTNVLIDCIKSVVGIEHLICIDSLPSIYNCSFDVMTTPLNINTNIGKRLQDSTYPNKLFQDIFSNDDSIKIFTDGSKTEGGLSVGCSCICPELNIIKTNSVNNKASIFTAESMALSDAMDVANTITERNVSIFTDSLSLVTVVKNPKINANVNPYVMKILH